MKAKFDTSVPPEEAPRCWDYPEIVMHDPERRCGRYTPGGVCRPLPGPSKDEDPEVWERYEKALLLSQGVVPQGTVVMPRRAQGITDYSIPDAWVHHEAAASLMRALTEDYTSGLRTPDLPDFLMGVSVGLLVGLNRPHVGRAMRDFIAEGFVKSGHNDPRLGEADVLRELDENLDTIREGLKDERGQ